jgi:pyrimidine-nucleoside phosphorylase
MNQPLGCAVGNSIEVKECIEILRGEASPGARPVLDLSLELSAHILVLARVDDSLDQARQRLQLTLDSGEALERFRENVEAQGGDPGVCDDPSGVLPLVSKSFKVESRRSGYITSVETAEVGHAVATLGGGRVRMEDPIDPTVGFMSEVKIGDQVTAGQTLGVVFSGDESRAQEAVTRIQAAYHVGDELQGDPPELIKEIINE